MTARRRTMGTAAWIVATAVIAVAAAGTDVKVTPLVNQGRVSASFSAPSAFTPDAGDVLKTGLPLTFTFIVELRRPSALLDRTIAVTTLASSVKYDNLTRDYQVSKQLEGRVMSSERTPDESTMRRWATSFESVSLDSSEKLEANVEYYVRVHLRASPRRSGWPWPFGHDDGTGQASFTFIR